MKHYTVKFYYWTDLRTEWSGQAQGELSALILAKSACRIHGDWTVREGFRIEIHHQSESV